MVADHALVGDRLAEAVGPAFVTRSARDLLAAGVSSGPTDPPAWLVKPGAAAEIATIIRVARDIDAWVLPVGTASRRAGAGRGKARPRIVIDMKRMSHVVFLDETSLVVQVQAGITGLGLEELLLPRGLTLGDFAPAALKSTVGGMLAVRTPGKASPRHGLMEDSVLGVSAVLADGRTIHTRVAPRRATGPDLARALLGSEGALAVITGAVLRIHRRPEARLLDSHRLPSLAAALDAAREALDRDARPAAMRVYDAAEATAHLGVEVGPDEAVLVVATAGAHELAAVDRQLVAEAARARGGEPLGHAPAEIWWRRRFGHAVAGPIPPPPVFEAAAPPSKLAAVHAAVVQAATSFGLSARAHVSRWSVDGACLFFTMLDGARPLMIAPHRPELESATRAAGGHVLGERDPAMTPYFASLRAELDPAGVFSP